MTSKATLVAIAALALGPSSTDGFTPSIFSRNVQSSTALSMGKSKTMPGPSSGGSSGPATSEYRMKKMRNRMNKKKKKGGFSDGDDIADGASSSKALMDVELLAEPEGGDEVSPLTAAAEGGFVIRLKDLGPVDESDEAYDLKEKLGAEVHNFWLTALADGNAIQKTRTIVLKNASKNANFPGFRVGQIPPYAQPKMTNFALQEVLVTSCQEAIKLFGVNEINEGQLGAVTFNENVDELSQKYNIKTFPSAPFTANFRATFDPNAVRETPVVDATDVESETEKEADSETD